MIAVPLRISTDINLTVTTTATNYYALVDTASGIKGLAQTFYDDANANAVMITVEGGDIRYIVDKENSASPTSDDGTLIKKGAQQYLSGIELNKLQLISLSGSVKVTIVPYIGEIGETPALKVSELLFDGDGNPIDSTNPLPVTFTELGVTSNNDGTIAFSLISVQVLPANANRRGLKMQYEGDGFCVLRRGGAASLAGSRYVRLNNLDVEELPSPIWRDDINVIFSGATGTLYFDET